MADIKTPISATATETQADDAVQNPTTTTNGALHGGVVHISLIFGPGINIDPAAIYDMVDAQFATVASQKEMVASRNYIFRIDS